MTVISRPDPKRVKRGLWVLSALLIGVAVAAQTPETVRESVDVIELSVLADVPSRRGTLGWDPVDVGDIELFEDGVQREVTGLDDSAETGWRVLVWIDGERCEPAWLDLQLRAIAASRRELLALGDPEIVVADPTPRRLTPPASLAGWEHLAGEVGPSIRCRDGPRVESQRLRLEKRHHEALIAAVDGEIRRNDLLLRHASTATAAGPALLLLVARGYDLRPHLRWAEPERPAGAELLAARAADGAEELGEGLAEGGWTVVVPAVPVPRSFPATGEAGGVKASPDHPELGPMLRVWPRRSRGQLRSPEQYEVFLDFKVEPWRRVAVLSAGSVSATAAELEAGLFAAASKRRVWYRSARPGLGESRRIRLQLRRSDEQPIPAPVLLPARWASTQVAAARIRGGGAGEGELPWRIEVAADGWRLASHTPISKPRRARWASFSDANATPEFQVGEFGDAASIGRADEASRFLYLEDLETGAWSAIRP